MNPIETAWLAGLLEGEAWFGTLRRPGGGRRMTIQLAMVDQDIVQRAADLMGVGVRMRKTPTQPQYIAVAQGQRAEELAKALLPYLGARRTIQVNEALGRCQTWRTIRDARRAS